MTSFYKLSGAGNDFLALVEPAEAPTPTQIRAWCRRRLSLGADGLFTLARQTDAVRMVHYNADGERSDLCLNGSRCAVQLASHLGWSREGALTLRTDAGDLAAQRLDGHHVRLALPPFIGLVQQRTLTVGDHIYDGFSVQVGVPHLVVPRKQPLADLAVATVAPPLRSHPSLGPAGANVHFVHFTSRQSFEIRSYERGVEAETLACGTGCVATVAAAVHTGLLDLPCRAATAGGFTLTVDGRSADGRLEGVTLAGDARLVARGELLQGAMVEPSDQPG